MPKCHFCDHNNPVGIDRCKRCGAWIEQKAGPTSTDSERQVEPSPDPDSLEGQVLALMEGGKKIEAIKLHRQQTGSGLKEAKDAVEALAASPDEATAGPQNLCCPPYRSRRSVAWMLSFLLGRFGSASKRPPHVRSDLQPSVETEPERVEWHDSSPFVSHPKASRNTLGSAPHVSAPNDPQSSETDALLPEPTPAHAT
jgi:hypothetical protein